MGIEIHKMPDDPGTDDTAWFDKRQNAFERQEIRRQVAYKRSQWPHFPAQASHRGSKHHYPHILPDEPGNEKLAYHEGIAEEALAYMKAANIEVHSEALNLKSSQAACINFLFPLRRDLTLASQVLGQILPDLVTVSGIEFEYTGQDEADRSHQPCTVWLGEPKSGKRGQHRTSIDAAVFWEESGGRSHISLIEWKYTERSFGTCSAFLNADVGGKARCMSLSSKNNPASSCILTDPGRHFGRRYWEHMGHAGISLDKLDAVEGCPFRGPFYQLMRQFLVAQFLRDQNAADEVDVISLEFEGNSSLRRIPQPLKKLCQDKDSTVVSAWNVSLEDVPLLRVVTAENLMAAYDATVATDADWREYIRKRYGL